MHNYYFYFLEQLLNTCPDDPVTSKNVLKKN